MIKRDFFSANSGSLHGMAVFFFLIVTTIGLSSTTDKSLTYISIVRGISIFLTAVISGTLLLFRRPSGPRLWLSVGILIGFILYGIALSAVYGGLHHVTNQLPVNFSVALIATILFSLSEDRPIIPENVAKLFLAYVAMAFIATVILGGFILSYPFKFVYEFSAGGSLYAERALYSQGTSTFYGLGAITAMFLAIYNKGSVKSYAYFATSVSMISLSVLGGGRGDILATILICVYLAAKKASGKLVISLLILAVTLTQIVDMIDLRDFPVFQRFLVFGVGNFGMRDQLLGNAFRLLAQEPQCILVGCGFGYFQEYYSLPSGLYPHNAFVEAIIVWGFIATLLMCLMLLRGINGSLARNPRDLFVPFIVFFALIDLKSGTVLGSWMLNGAIASFSAWVLTGGRRHVPSSAQVRGAGL